MTRLALALLLPLLLTVSLCQRCNATSANYLSPHSLGKQDELNDTLTAIGPGIRPSITMYQYGKTNFTLFNFSIKMLLNDGRQTADVISGDEILVNGSTVEFQVNFNYSISKIGPDQYGWAYASVITDPISFIKEIDIDQYSHPYWNLQKGTPPITISNPMPIKRIQPKQTEDTITGLNQALYLAITGITPTNIRNQLIQLINANYTTALKKALNQKVITNTTKYSFNHPIRGVLQLNFTNEMYSFNITKDDGFELYFTTMVQDWPDHDCNHSVPEQHENFTQFGGIQTTISMDLMRHTALKALKKGWLDASFSREWETNAFQFYVGDLYEVIPESMKLPPRTAITGNCTAHEDSFFSVKRYSDDAIQVNINYTCLIETNDTARTRLADFSLSTNIRVNIVAKYETLELNILKATGIPSFNPVGQYVVTDADLGMFKIERALTALTGYRVFGSGYPIWPRDLPSIWIRDQYALIYDESQKPHISKLKKS